MELKEIAKKMTREEFLNKFKNKCPSDFGINYYLDCGFDSCEPCLKCAVKDIKFKGEETLKAICINDQSEEYKDFKAVPKREKVKGLTRGKEYEVKQSQYYDNYYELVNDNGELHTYKKDRFKFADEIVEDIHKNMQEAQKLIGKRIEKLKNNSEGEKMEEKILKVRCIDNLQGQQHLTVGKEYKVDKVKEDDGICLSILNDRERKRWYSEELFEKVEDVLIVECIDNKDVKLTLNKKYTVMEECKGSYLIMQDKGRTTWFSKNRFKPVEPQKEIKEYTVIELLDFPIGTKFKYDQGTIIIVDHEEGNKGTEIVGTNGGIELTTNWLKTKFTLIEEPKPVSTSEAFKALEEGETIESLVTHDRYSKGVKTINIELHDEREEGFNKCMNISIAELEGQWIIIKGDK